MRFIISLLGLAALAGLIFFAALVAMEIDMAVIQAEVFNATIAAWNKVWAEGVDFLPLLPALGWVLALLVVIMLLGGFLASLGGMATRAFRRGATAKPTAEKKPNAPDFTLQHPRWWWSKSEKFRWDLAVVSKITGIVPIRSAAAARQALQVYMQSMIVLMRNLERDYEPIVAHRNQLPSHRDVLQLQHDLLVAAKADGKIIIEAAKPAAKMVKLPKLGRWARFPAALKLLLSGEAPAKPTTPRKRAAPKPKAAAAPAAAATAEPPAETPAPVSASGPSALETAPAAAPATAVAAARLDVHIHSAPSATESVVVVEDVVEEPTSSATSGPESYRAKLRGMIGNGEKGNNPPPPLRPEEAAATMAAFFGGTEAPPPPAEEAEAPKVGAAELQELAKRFSREDPAEAPDTATAPLGDRTGKGKGRKGLGDRHGDPAKFTGK